MFQIIGNGDLIPTGVTRFEVCTNYLPLRMCKPLLLLRIYYGTNRFLWRCIYWDFCEIDCLLRITWWSVVPSLLTLRVVFLAVVASRRYNICSLIVRGLAPCGVRLRCGLTLQLSSRAFYKIISVRLFNLLEVRAAAVILCNLFGFVMCGFYGTKEIIESLRIRKATFTVC